MDPSDDGATPVVDTAELSRLLGDHPVRVGVLFGSRVRGTETPESDVDLAVEFDGSLSDEGRHRARIALIVDLMEAFGVDDVDVVDLDTVRPRIGASALRTGVVILGDEDRIARLREDFESRTASRSHEERMRRFDELLERIEAAV